MLTRRTFNAALVGMTAATVTTGPSLGQSGATSADAIDGHAHVFKVGLPLADARRYAPDYDATPAAYLAQMEANGIARGVLVQPSFLGTDNSYMLEALRDYPDRFRGIAVVAPDISVAALRDLDRAGVVGIRLNLVGAPNPSLDQEPWPRLLGSLADLGWQVEVQAEAHRWPALLPAVLKSGVNVVADHFGKPDLKLGVDDPGLRHLLEQGRTGRVWVKLSGSYRNRNGEVGAQIPSTAVAAFRDALGLERLVWGSDWPHTQFEKATNYRAARAELDTWVPDPADRAIILRDAPKKLFKFS